MSDAPPEATLAQDAWRRFCRFMTRIFYRRFEVAGRENLPATGAVILCANHVNALVDAVVVQASCPRPIHPLARSGLFRSPLLRPILRAIQAVPIYRRRQAAGESDAAPDAATSRNEDSFRRCYDFLAEHRTLLIFPEGQSHSDPRLRTLKTGAARLALGSRAQNGVLPAVVPVGLTFTHKGRFRSSVLVQIGEPVAFAEVAGEDGEEEDFEASVHRLTAAIGDGLERVTLNLDSWEDLSLLRLLQSFFALRRDRHTLSRRFRSLRQLVEAHRRLRFDYPEQVASLREKLRRFERLCARYGVADYQLNLRYSPWLVTRFVARALAFALLVFPLALWGVLNSALPYLATRQATRLAARARDQYDTAGMLFGLGFFALCWSAQTFLVYHLWGLWPAVGYGASLPLTGAVALKVGYERKRILENVRVFLLFVRRKDLRGYLRSKRRELEVDVAQMTLLARRAAEEPGGV